MAQEPSTAGEHQSLTRHTIQGIFWLTVGRFLKTPLSLIAVAVLARLLTPADFGIVAIGGVVVTLSNVLVDGSFGMVLIQRRKLGPDVIAASLLLSAGLALIMAIIVVVSAPWVQAELNFPHLREVLFFLAAVLPITALTSVTSALLQRSFDFRLLTINGFVSQSLYTASAIALAVMGYGLWSLVWAQIIQFMSDALLGYFAVRRRYTLRFSTAAVGETLRSGGMFTASKILNWAANNVDNLMIGRFLGPADLGFYSRAFTLMTTARNLSGAGPVRVLFSTFAKMQHDPQRMAKAYLRALSASIVASTLVSAFVVVNSELIVRVMLGPKWLAAIPVLQIMFSAFLARTGYIIAESVPLALGRAGQTAARNAVQLVLIFAGAAIGSQFGLIPAVAGIASAYWIFYFLCLILVQRLIPIRGMEVLRVHLKGVLVAAPPLLAALATEAALRDHNIFLLMIPPFVFGIVTLALLAFAPPALVSDDVARGRALLWSKLRPHVPARLWRGA